jgi:hypothetical protein
MDSVSIGTTSGDTQKKQDVLDLIAGKTTDYHSRKKRDKKDDPSFYQVLPGYDVGIQYGIGALMAGPAIAFMFQMIEAAVYTGVALTLTGVYLLTAKYLHFKYTVENMSLFGFAEEVGKGLWNMGPGRGIKEVKGIWHSITGIF